MKCKSTSLLKMLKKEKQLLWHKASSQMFELEGLNKVGLAELNVSLIDVLVECPFCNKQIRSNCH